MTDKKTKYRLKPEDEEVTNVSDIVGAWGQWQRNIFIFFFIGAMCSCWHSLGLSFGVYSDAGTSTCGGAAGSLGYETIDAASYAFDWQIDYLKYDDCNSRNLPYETRFGAMRDALEATGKASNTSFAKTIPS